MSLGKTQVDKLIEQLSLVDLQDGRNINLNKIQGMLKEILGDRQGVPTLKYKPQKRKSVFDIEHYNDFFDKFQFDIEVAYEEISKIVYESLLKLNTFELSYRAQSHQLNQIIDELDNLLFTIDNANGNFYGVFDAFTSVDKTNISASTPKIVDVQEECLSLPFNNATGKKISMNHLYGQSSWPITISRDVVSFENSSSAGFGNAFSDIYSPWRAEIVTSSPGPVTIQFDVPLSALGDMAYSLTRVQLIPHSSKEMNASIQYTVDDINYIIFPGSGSSVLLEQESKTYNVDFASTQAEKVRFVVTKNDYDEENQDGNYVYYFGFKHIGFYTLGTAIEAQYISKDLKPVGITKSIDSVSLLVSEQIPKNTDVEYFISLADSNGSQVGDWELICPANRNKNFVGKRVIEFRNTAKKVKEIHSPASLAKFETYKSIDFYKLPTGMDSGDTHVFGSNELYRGYSLWNKNTNEDTVLRQVKDSYITFNAGDVQDIYAVVTEVAAVNSGYQTFYAGGVSTGLVTKFIVSNPVNYRIQTMSLVPDPEINPIVDQRPNYAVYEVKRFGTNMNITGEIINLTGTVVSSFANDVMSDPANDPVITNTSNGTIYERDADYLLVQDADGVLNQIRRTDESNIVNGENVAAAYGINSNITQQVSAIRDNSIYMKSLMDIKQDDRIEVTYRFVPKGNNAVIRPTLRVSSRFGDEDEGQLYNQGPDYAVNINQGKITRIPQGNITPNQGDLAVYVDFYYKENPTDLHTYSTWVFQPSLEPVKIEYNALTINLDLGEKLVLNSTNLTIDLSNSTETPFLPRGWHQFIVKSRDPNIFSSAAINKVIELKDIDNDYIFVRGGKYFSELQAIRTAMTEVTYDFLKNGVLAKNHQHFAVKNNDIIVNFKPGSTQDFYTYRPLTSNSGVVTGFDTQNTEDFLLKYRYRLPEEITADRLLVKAELSKTKSTDGGITPKVFRYNARIK